MPYCNMDKKLIRKGGRFALKITKEAFSAQIANYLINRGYLRTSDYLPGTVINEDHISLNALKESNIIENDFKSIFFDTENAGCDPFGQTQGTKGLLGIHTLPNGLTFLGMNVGGDWEIPLFLIIYWDGALRGYIPRYGNTVNLDWRSAFGSETESPHPYVKNPSLLRQYHDNIRDASTEYLLRQGFTEANLENKEVYLNWAAILEDIVSRIIVK